jgi:hypothetical protein
MGPSATLVFPFGLTKPTSNEDLYKTPNNPRSAKATYKSPTKILFLGRQILSKNDPSSLKLAGCLTNTLKKILCSKKFCLTLHLFLQQLSKQLT